MRVVSRACVTHRRLCAPGAWSATGIARAFGLALWELSSIRSRERRQRTARGRTRTATHSAPASLSAMLDARNRTAARDLAEELPWDLLLGRSRARRRAAELRFVPASSRAKRISLGALAALTAGPAASMAGGSSDRRPPWVDLDFRQYGCLS
jgi:hypothetical protein